MEDLWESVRRDARGSLGDWKMEGWLDMACVSYSMSIDKKQFLIHSLLAHTNDPITPLNHPDNHSR